MANQSSGRTGFSGTFGDAGAFRAQSIEAPAEAARGAATETLLEVAGLMTVLPNAVIASQQRELERLRATRGDDDPRVAQLEASLERAATLSALAERGNARLQRAAVAFAGSEAVFHGFVSDTSLDPLPNLIVRIGSQFSATTDADGYFRIPLGATVARASGMLAALGNIGRVPPRDSTGGTTGLFAEGQVEIVQKGTVLHTDPTPVPLDQGRVYREYVIPHAPASASALKKFVASSARAESPAPKRAKRAKAKPKPKR